MRLENKVAIVTGAATGIGKGIAIRFAQEGAAVVIDYVPGQEDDANALVAELQQHHEHALAVSADISQEDQVKALVGRAVSEYGKLDIFVNNAGIEKKFDFVDTPLDYWNRVIAINLTGPFLCCREAARQMILQGQGGRIINISSVHEDIPMPTNGPYCAAKGGMRMLTRTACLELAPHNITINNIGPGAIDTPMDAPLKAQPELFQQLLDHIPLGRMGQPEDVAAVATFLASDEAGYVTGASYFVDGGMMRFATSL